MPELLTTEAQAALARIRESMAPKPNYCRWCVAGPYDYHCMCSEPCSFEGCPMLEDVDGRGASLLGFAPLKPVPVFRARES